MGLKSDIIKSLRWQVGAIILQKIITIVATIILARRLGPSAFGLLALALVVINAFDLFKSLGIDTALVRIEGDFQKAASTAFTIIPLLGLALFMIMAVSAPWIGGFLSTPEIIPLLRVLGTGFLIQSVARVPAVILERQMRFKEISLAELIGALAYSSCALVLAFSGLGIWALICAYILRAFVYAVFVWIFAGWRPHFGFDKKIAGDMIGFGKFLFMVSVLWFLKLNLDNLLVGKLMGIAQLGFYTVAFNLANFAADYLGGKVYRVIYPAYSKIQNDRDGLMRAVLKTLQYVGIIALPFGFGLFLLGGDFLEFAYGPKWAGAQGVMKILAFAGIFNMLPIAFGGLFSVIGKPKFSFFSISAQVILFVALIVPGAKLFHLVGVGTVVCLASLTSFLMELGFSSRLLSLSIFQLLKCLRTPFLASLVMAMGTSFVKVVLFPLKKETLFFLPDFIFLFALAVTLYGLSLVLLDKNIYREVRKEMFG